MTKLEGLEAAYDAADTAALAAYAVAWDAAFAVSWEALMEDGKENNNG
jgi:hypothetical protein